MPLLLTRDEVTKVIEMFDCMEVVERAFTELTSGTAVQPPRIKITLQDGLALYMPAYLKQSGVLACKVVTDYRNNPVKHNRPAIIGKVILHDLETGDVICIMDGSYLTAVRTGAVSGIATKYLARNNKGQKVGIFGAGVQAKMQLRAMAIARDVAKAYVYDVIEEAVNKFVKEMKSELDLEVVRADSPNHVVDEADIICTATSSPRPIFNGDIVKEGTHINAIGSHTPNTRELDTIVIKRSKVVIDSYEACLSEAGDIMMPIQEGAIDETHVHAELGEIIMGKKSSRTDDKEITLFKSVGLAIQDAAAAKLVYDKAIQLGIGTDVQI